MDYVGQRVLESWKTIKRLCHWPLHTEFTNGLKIHKRILGVLLKIPGLIENFKF
jgi:hypothetical protein